MPLFLLRYVSAKGELVSFAVIEARDSVLARRQAEATNLHYPGLLALADQVDRASVLPDMIGRKLNPADLPIKKPAAPSLRRRRSVRAFR
jgi:hypothetical protein